jgi:hypothetical protein
VVSTDALTHLYIISDEEIKEKWLVLWFIFKKCFNVEIWNILKNIKEYIKDYSYNRWVLCSTLNKGLKRNFENLPLKKVYIKLILSLLISLDHHNSLLKSTLRAYNKGEIITDVLVGIILS